MKRYSILLLILLLYISLSAQVNGSLSALGDKTILKVWGDHYQRGYAQGYLLAYRIFSVWQDYYWTMVSYSDPVFYQYLTNYYYSAFASDPDLQAEAMGIAIGMQESGANVFIPALNREFDMDDILLMNSLVDMIAVRNAKSGKNDLVLGCASLSSWGTATQDDPFLEGGAVITRFLDWSPNSAIIANPLMVVHFPSEADEMPWANITIPGFIGALTGVSENGTFASMNIGSDHNASIVTGLRPVLSDIRRGLEKGDFNASGMLDPQDLFSSLSSTRHHSATITHTLGLVASQPYSRVIEASNAGTVQRAYNQNGNLPLMNLAATNHFRATGNIACCTRYGNIQDSLYTNPHVTAKRQWAVLSGAAGMENTLSAVQFNSHTNTLLWAAATSSAPAYMLPTHSFTLDEIFANPVSNTDATYPVVHNDIRIYPNPFANGGILSVESKADLNDLSIYNAKGQRVYRSLDDIGKSLVISDLPSLVSGVYIVKASTQKGVSMRKLVVIR